MNLFQLLFVPLCTLLAMLTAVRALRGQWSRRYGIAWTMLWLAGAMAIAQPNATTVVASWLGIGRGADLVFYLAIAAGLGACIYFYNRYRRLETLLTELVRRDAIDHAQRGLPPARSLDEA